MAAKQPPVQDPPGTPAAGEKLSIAAGVLWLGLGGALLWVAPDTIGLTGFLVPLALLVAAYVQARQLRKMRQQAADLRQTLDAIQKPPQPQAPGGSGPLPDGRDTFAETYAQTPPPAENGLPDAPAERPLFRSHPRPGAAVAAQGDTAAHAPDQAVPTPAFASRRDLTAVQLASINAPQTQLSLGLGQDDAPPLAVPDFISALHFPQSPEDTDGFRALRLALRHPPSVPLIQAAQDVLTLMSQIGLYMDDLHPDHARPELWRRFFADGERGGIMGTLGGIRDTDALLTCANRMHDDPVFRDATHHFLRRFELTVAARIDDLDDSDLIRLADTRSTRAFMLLGRAAGIFE